MRVIYPVPPCSMPMLTGSPVVLSSDGKLVGMHVSLHPPETTRNSSLHSLSMRLAVICIMCFWFSQVEMLNEINDGHDVDSLGSSASRKRKASDQQSDQLSERMSELHVSLQSSGPHEAIALMAKFFPQVGTIGVVCLPACLHRSTALCVQPMQVPQMPGAGKAGTR
jgi:hypothetical protein